MPGNNRNEKNTEVKTTGLSILGKKEVIALIIGLFLLCALFRGKTYLQLWTGLSEKPFFGRDFYGNFYVYGKMYRQGFFNVYKDENIKKFAVKLNLKPVFKAYYAPPVISLHVPFTFLNRKTATRLYFILNHMWLFLTILVMNRIFIQGKKWKESLMLTAGMFLFFLLFSPVIDNLFSGQINLLLTFLFSLFLYFYHKDRLVPASLFLALAINVKYFPLFVIPVLLMQKRWRLMGYTALFAIGLNVPFLFVKNPLEIYTGLVKKILFLSGGIGTYNRQSLVPGILRLMNVQKIDPLVFSMFNILTALVFLTIVIAVVIKYNQKEQAHRIKTDDVLLLTLSSFLFFLGSSYVYPTHHVLAICLFVVLFHYTIKHYPRNYYLSGFTLAAFLGLLVFDGETGASRNDIVFRVEALYYSAGYVFMLAAFIANIIALLGEPEKQGESAG